MVLLIIKIDSIIKIADIFMYKKNGGENTGTGKEKQALGEIT